MVAVGVVVGVGGQVTERKVREWTLNVRDGIINDNSVIVEYKGAHPPLQSDMVRVIESSAYDAIEDLGKTILALCEVIEMQREAMEPWAAIQAANNPLRDALVKTDKVLAELAEGK